MRRRHRSAKEIDIDILSLLVRNPNGISIGRLRMLINIGYKTHLPGLEKRELITIEEIQQIPARGTPKRRKLSNNPRFIVRRIVRITREGRKFLKKEKGQILN